MVDFKPIISTTYPLIIKATLDRLIYFETDSILSFLVASHIKITTEENSEFNADEELIITDKFYIYKMLWKAILETLYTKYLPHQKYNFEWQIECTPYSVMICEFTEEYSTSKELDKLTSLLKISEDQLEENYDEIITKLGFDKIDLPNELSALLPSDMVPSTRKEQLHLFFRLMSFPPLQELGLFYSRYNNFIKVQTSKLAEAFPSMEKPEIPNFGMPEPLHLSLFQIYHKTFERHGIDGFENNPALAEYLEDFQQIRKLVAEHIGNFKDSWICPCCGEKQEIKLPEEILAYRYLLENLELSKRIGLTYFSEFKQNYKEDFTTKVFSFLPNLNKVNNPDCLILVEGESEESSIPILAFRKRFILKESAIQVYNSKSKEKLATDFQNFSSRNPKLKIICLLDSDAKKERKDIERMIRSNKDKYSIIFIEQGTFEDLFDLNTSIEILNEMYPKGETIVATDFDGSKDFLSNVKKFLFQKKKAQFDKVLFAKKIAMKIDIDKVPTAIEQLLEIANTFTLPKKFLAK
ncbi:hypothetical protein [Pedobacter sp. UBA4863]|uniref:hypothetical protein n=1 Tax=Pedobacter sp. UBA4863 TaxID=1947060 RepID=UPI0025DE69E1|nr:hypothetical protein [Pedobacter sp. UBA4863]